MAESTTVAKTHVEKIVRFREAHSLHILSLRPSTSTGMNITLLLKRREVQKTTYLILSLRLTYDCQIKLFATLSILYVYLSIPILHMWQIKLLQMYLLRAIQVHKPTYLKPPLSLVW